MIFSENELHDDPVSKPSHYTQGNIECLEYIRDVLGPEGFSAFCHGQVIKYTHRNNLKGSRTENLQKAQFYLEEWLNEVQR